MNNLNQKKMPMVDPSRFAMVPRSDVPRSTFRTSHSYKTTFNLDYLVPFHVDEVLPGDVHQGKVVIFARLANLLFPLMDHMEVETFFFFVPSRILWDNWTRMMGEQDNPASSIAYTVPQCAMNTSGFLVGSVFDYFGLPTVGQVAAGGTGSVNALPLRAYNLIYNQWFRDEDLQNSVTAPTTDGPDAAATYSLLKRNKKHDYFTSCRPWPLKGGVELTLPIGGLANVKTAAAAVLSGAQSQILWKDATAGATPTANSYLGIGTSGGGGYGGSFSPSQPVYPSNLVADLSTATGATINAMRLTIATQQFLEKNARGGTRYTELLHNHFGVMPEDSRLQRPEYCGGGRSSIQTQAIPQTSATNLTGGSTPQGSLTAQGIMADRHTFQYHAKEHGYLIGLVSVSADLTYQQGLPRMWSRQTRYDFYWPTFAHLGEQAVLNKEIYYRGDANDDLVFGYQERWAEYRYRPSRITGLFKSTSALNIDEWVAAEQFTSLPTLGSTFIQYNTPGTRIFAAGATSANVQVLLDSVFDIKCTRPLPTYSVPGLTRF